MKEEHVHASKIAKAHTVYKVDGKRVPGTTTITGVMDKPALVKWANNLGLQGIDSSKYVDELAQVGTLAHFMIENHCLGEIPDLSDFSPNQIKLAENSFYKFLEWQDQTGFEPHHNELILTSKEHMFGGTLDIVGTLTKRNNLRALVDIKTCKGIYPEHKTQVAGGYMILAKENVNIVGPLDTTIIIRVGRNEDEGFEEVQINKTESALHQKRFLICRELYEINKAVNK
jgi:hypothetical protein